MDAIGNKEGTEKTATKDEERVVAVVNEQEYVELLGRYWGGYLNGPASTSKRASLACQGW